MTGKLRILVVDDNPDHAHLALRALRGDDTLSVASARHGRECLRRVEEEPFDLVVLDYRLPDMTGLDLLRRLDVPAILMTSQGTEEVAIQALEEGAVNYVVKDGDLGLRLRYEVKRFREARA